MGQSLAILGTRGVPAQYGGFETFAEELGSRLAEAGIDVTVYCEAKSQDGEIKAYRGMRLEYVRCPNLGPLTTILFDVLCLLRAWGRFSVVYMLGYSASFFCFVPRLFNSEVWINMDGVEWERTKWSWLGRSYIKVMAFLAMKTANRIIADAQEMADILQRRFATVPNCTVIAYGADPVLQGPDATPLALWGLSPQGYYLVVCRLEPENYVREIVLGFLASNSSRTLVVVGDHRTSTAYVRDLIRLGAGGRVAFLGPIYDKAQLTALRYYCFAYFHGHSVGGTNPSLLEAMACSNAVIAHDNRFNREVASDAALFFNDSDGIPHLCADLERDSEMRRRLGVKGLERITEKYLWMHVASRYLDLLCMSQGSEKSGGRQ